MKGAVMNQVDLKGRVAVVTGGAQGIGLATSERLLKSGARVVLWDVDQAQLATAQAVLSAVAGPQAVRGEWVELTDDAAVAAATAQVLARESRIDILVNNAGITGGNASTWELDPAVWRRVIEVNLIAPYLTCRHVVPAMLPQRYGRIVNIASVAGKEGNPNASHYSASKAGLIALTKSAAKELGSRNILINAIAPGFIDTEMTQALSDEVKKTILKSIPAGVLGKPVDVARAALYLASDESSFITGQVITVDGGMVM